MTCRWAGVDRTLAKHADRDRLVLNAVELPLSCALSYRRCCVAQYKVVSCCMWVCFLHVICCTTQQCYPRARIKHVVWISGMYNFNFLEIKTENAIFLVWPLPQSYTLTYFKPRVFKINSNVLKAYPSTKTYFSCISRCRMWYFSFL